MSPIAPLPSALPAAAVPAPAGRVRDAASQFEALLLAQILKSAHTDAGWLGSGEDQAASCALEVAQEQFAQALAQSGGLGIADMLAKGLERAPA